MSVYTGDATKMATSVKKTKFSLFSCTLIFFYKNHSFLDQSGGS